MKEILKSIFPKRFRLKIRLIVNRVALFFLKDDFGKRTYVDKSVHMTGRSAISIGSNSVISESVWMNVNVRKKGEKRIVIGSNCYIGRRCFFSSGKKIQLGDYCLVGLECKFIGENHVFEDPLKPYITTGLEDKSEQVIETNVWAGTAVTFLGAIVVGRGSVIGAGTLVNKDIPPFSVVVGVPCRVIKRYDFSRKKWVSSKQYDDANDALIPSEFEYLDILRNNSPDVIIPLHAASRKFGDLL